MRPYELFASKFFTISNILSLCRVLLIPIFWYFIAPSNFTVDSNFYLLIVVGLMVLTDFLDGFIARKLGQETPLGQYLDPIADKIAIVGSLSLLCYYRNYPKWIILFIVAREILGIWLGIFLFIKKDVLGKPNYWGKIGVVLVALSGIFYIVQWPYKDLINILVFIVWSGGIIAYGKKYWKTVFK